jgi:hypothetical protein
LPGARPRSENRATVRLRHLICVLVSLVANVAVADKTKAREHFRNGMAQLLLNHYHQAIPELEAGFAEAPAVGLSQHGEASPSWDARRAGLLPPQNSWIPQSTPACPPNTGMS